MKKSLWTITGLVTLFFVFAFVFPFIVKSAEPAPILNLSGDDKFADGGNNDPYDSLLILDVDTFFEKFDDYRFDYSYDQYNWNSFYPQYKVIENNKRHYYWSISGLNNGTVYLRVAYIYDSRMSEYNETEFLVKHETPGRRGSYFVEDFTSSLWFDSGNSKNVSWPLESSVRLIEGSEGYAYSTNLASDTSGDILSVAFQPVLSDYDPGQNIKFQLSNNGSDWYGTGGIDTYIEFFESVPQQQTVFFTGQGNRILWRAVLSKNGGVAFPEIFKVRLQWEVNSPPLPCFTFAPMVSSNPNETFVFNASCSSDYNPGTGLNYAWSWDGGKTVGPYSGSASASRVFGTTSSSTVVLYVVDSYGSEATTSDIVNMPGVQDSIYGWSWNINYGWTSLNCDNIYYGESIDLCSNSTYKVMMNENRTVSGWAWNGNLGWLCFGYTCSPYGVAPDGTTPNAIYNMVNGYINGWARYIKYNNDPEQGWVKLRGEKINGSTWCGVDGKNCTYLNFGINGISGWAWGGAVDAYNNVIGPGWEYFMGVINAPWFETKFSSIYSMKKIGSETQFGSPSGKFTATYCIWSDDEGGDGSITNVSSQYNCLKPNYSSDVKFPGEANKYRTIDGILDINKMIDSARKSGNEYGTDNVGSVLDAVRPLDGKIYYFNTGADSKYTIDQALTFFNGRNKDGSASGTVVVNGDLYINNSIRYENSAVLYSSRNLASVAFIVLGDIIIDPSVDVVSGVFVALGKSGLQQSCDRSEPGCGMFLTGNDGGSPRKLTVNGMVMARKFSLDRTFKQSSSPAEVFNYDGRVSINTPPGLTNVAGGLPIWRETLAK